VGGGLNTFPQTRRQERATQSPPCTLQKKLNSSKGTQEEAGKQAGCGRGSSRKSLLGRINAKDEGLGNLIKRGIGIGGGKSGLS